MMKMSQPLYHAQNGKSFQFHYHQSDKFLHQLISEKRISMESLPDDVVRDVLIPFACCNSGDAFRLMLVSKRFHKLVSNSQGLWKAMYLTRFPFVAKAPSAVKSWFKFFERRSKVDKKLVFGERTIENCTLVFQCPLRWSELNGTVEVVAEGSRRLCSECNRQVYQVNHVADLTVLANRGECVAYMEEREILMGMWCEPEETII